MAKKEKKNVEALDDEAMNKVSGGTAAGISAEDISLLYDAGFKLQVKQNYIPEHINPFSFTKEGGRSTTPANTSATYTWTNGSTSFSPNEIGKVVDILRQNP